MSALTIECTLTTVTVVIITSIGVTPPPFPLSLDCGSDTIFNIAVVFYLN